MPRPIKLEGPAAIETVNRIRELQSFSVFGRGQTTRFDTIKEAVTAQPDQNFQILHTYQDLFDADGKPSNRLSGSEIDLVDRLCYERFVRPFERIEEEEDE